MVYGDTGERLDLVNAAEAVAKHLVVLEEAGLVSRRKQGREVLYLVEADRLDQATRAMAELAADWDRRLTAIKRLAEAAHAANAASEQDKQDGEDKESENRGLP